MNGIRPSLLAIVHTAAVAGLEVHSQRSNWKPLAVTPRSPSRASRSSPAWVSQVVPPPTMDGSSTCCNERDSDTCPWRCSRISLPCARSADPGSDGGGGASSREAQNSVNDAPPMLVGLSDGQSLLAGRLW